MVKLKGIPRTENNLSVLLIIDIILAMEYFVGLVFDNSITFKCNITGIAFNGSSFA